MMKNYATLVMLSMSLMIGSTLYAEPLSLIEVKPHIHIGAAVKSGPAGYTPAQIRSAYGFDKLMHDGLGQKIAIVDAYGSPTIQKDLDVFCAQFGLPSTTVQIYYPNGKPIKGESGWALETALDVEWAHAIAPGAAILLIIAKDSSLGNLLNAVDYAVKLGARQISMSWGSPEFPQESMYDMHFNNPYVTFVASSGDNGAGVSWPAVSPYVIGVGGTTLTLDALGNVISEIAWSGSGGGTSAFVSKPSYQSQFQTSDKRMVPDVSYNANPSTGYCVYNSTPVSGHSGWFTIGGTSAGAPQWASLVAIVNSSTTSLVNTSDSLLYQLVMPNTLSPYFHDIISGNNGGYNAQIGYDEVTGLGSPYSNMLVPELSNK